MGSLQFSEQTEEKWVGGTEGKQDKWWGGENGGQTLVRLQNNNNDNNINNDNNSLIIKKIKNRKFTFSTNTWKSLGFGSGDCR